MSAIILNQSLKHKMDNFEYLTNRLRNTLAGLYTDEKYRTAERSFHAKVNKLVELAKANAEIPRALIKGLVTLHNIQVQQLNKRERKYYKLLSRVRKLGTEIRTEIDSVKNKKLIKRYNKLQNEYLPISQQGEKIIDSIYPDYAIIEAILDLAPITKDEFLEVFPLNKNKPDKYNQSKDNYLAAKEYIQELPDSIDGKTFIRFMSTDGYILSNDDVASYYIEMTYKRMKEAGFDWFSAWQETIGKPLPTFTVKQDEFGNVVHVEQNKPKFTVVK